MAPPAPTPAALQWSLFDSCKASRSAWGLLTYYCPVISWWHYKKMGRVKVGQRLLYLNVIDRAGAEIEFTCTANSIFICIWSGTQHDGRNEYNQSDSQIANRARDVPKLTHTGLHLNGGMGTFSKSQLYTKEHDVNGKTIRTVVDDIVILPLGLCPLVSHASR